MTTLFFYHIDRWLITGTAIVEFEREAATDSTGRETESATAESVEIENLKLGQQELQFALLPATLRAEIREAAYQEAVKDAEIVADRKREYYITTHERIKV